MNNQYRELFQLIARNGAICGENAMEVLKNGEKTEPEIKIDELIKSIKIFNDIEDRLKNGKELKADDYPTLLLGAWVSRDLLQKNINTWTALVEEYDKNLIPKIKEVALEQNDEKKATLIEDFFS